MRRKVLDAGQSHRAVAVEAVSANHGHDHTACRTTAKHSSKQVESAKNCGSSKAQKEIRREQCNLQMPPRAYGETLMQNKKLAG